MTACIIIVRDRLTLLKECLASLEPYRSDLEIYLVDHGSTWRPMVDWLDRAPYPVWLCGDVPPRGLWDWPGLSTLVEDKPYVVTDPDVVLDCPADWLQVMHTELDRSDAIKVGLSLRIDDLPDTPLTVKVRGWESAFWSLPDGRSYRAPVDTTIALYRPLTVQPAFLLGPSLRLAPPYSARHLPWYQAGDDAESVYYRQRVLPGASHWANGGW